MRLGQHLGDLGQDRALGAFFLAWSLPMTLLGSIYAAGYLRPCFATQRHVGVHYALLNMTAISFVLIYAGRLRDIGLSAWWALVIPVVTLGVLFGGLNLSFSLQQGVPNWQFSWTLLMLEGTMLLSVVAWLGPTIWLGLRPSVTDR